MKKRAFFFLALCSTITLFGDELCLMNKTSYPQDFPNSTMAIQWASSAQEVDRDNKALLNGDRVDPSTLAVLKQSGSNKLVIPDKAQHFRVLVWTKGEGEPDLHTNWVDVVPNKTYTLQNDHLVPTVLMAGMGC